MATESLIIELDADADGLKRTLNSVDKSLNDVEGSVKLN